MFVPAHLRCGRAVPVPLLFLVEMVHRELNARERETFNHFAGQFQSFVHGFEVLLSKLSQYEVNLSAAGEIVADAKAQTGILLRAEHTADMFQSVVSGFAAAWAHSQLPEGQREVVDHHEHVFHRDFLLVHPVAHRVAREIHVGGGLEKRERLVFHLQRGDGTISLVLKYKIGRLSQGVQYSKSYVVTGLGIFATDIPQPDNQKIHLLMTFFSFALPLLVFSAVAA